MTRLHLLLGLACLTGAAATTASTSPQGASPNLPAAAAAPSTAKGSGGAFASVKPDQIAWVSRFGRYNVSQGSWEFLSDGKAFLPNGKGC
jgi:hypothetical protein